MRLQITLLFTALLATVLFLFPCKAEPHLLMPYRFEAFGNLGGAKYDASKSHEFNFGGGFGFRPFSKSSVALRGVGFEFEADRTSGESTYLPARKTATGEVLYHFSFNRTEPYVFIGMGGSRLGCYGLNLGCDQGIRVGVGGLGVRFFLNDRVSLRPEFRIFKPMGSNACILGPGGCAYHLYRASIGVSYYWR